MSYNLQPPLEPYTVYNLNQLTQTILLKKYPDAFEVHDTNSPISDYTSNPLPTSDVTQVSMKIPLEIPSQNNKLDPRYQSFLRKPNFTICPLLSQEVFKFI